MSKLNVDGEVPTCGCLQ